MESLKNIQMMRYPTEKGYRVLESLLGKSFGESAELDVILF